MVYTQDDSAEVGDDSREHPISTAMPNMGIPNSIRIRLGIQIGLLQGSKIAII